MFHGEETYLEQTLSYVVDGQVKALDEQDNLLGVVVSKLEKHRGGNLRGYIAMLAVREEHRGKGVATKLVRMAIDAMIEKDAEEVFESLYLSDTGAEYYQIGLETEVTNTAAMKLYERLGFLRSKRLHRYYLNGNSAFRFMLFLKESAASYSDEYEQETQLPPRPPSA